MLAMAVGIVLLFVPEPTVGYACRVGHTIQMRGDPPAVFVFVLNPDLVTFPHIASSDSRMWRNCGEAIGKQAGIEVEYNQAMYLCYEVMHIVDPELRF